MKYYFKSKSKKYLLATILLLILSPILGLTYSSFIFSSDNYRASEMYIGSLMYSIKIDGVATSTVSVPSGSSEYTIEVTSLNTVDSFYKLVYEKNDNISVLYKEENDVPNGSISNTKTIVLQITNNSSSNILVNFDVASGYINNGLEQVIIPEGFKEILGVFVSNDISIIAIYVDNKLVDSLDNSKSYKLIDYDCKNNETVEWNSSDKGLLVYPMLSNTSCSVYFEESKILHEIILADYNGGESDENIDFNYISSPTNGEGLYYTSDTSITEDYDGDGEGDRVYYYRGNVDNNYLYFADKCWRMVRIVEDGTVRLKYGGSPTIEDDGSITCPQTGVDVSVDTSVDFNCDYNDNRYVGYMYGNTCTSYATCHKNDNDSCIKDTLTKWYNSNIHTTQSEETLALIKDSIYCNDRGLYSGNGYSTQVTLYSGWGRLFTATDKAPTYKCSRADDRFSQLTANGNGLNTHPVGLLTADEVAFAGGVSDVANTTYFMHNAKSYWLMTAAHFNGIGMSAISQPFLVYNDGSILGDNVAAIGSALMPAISIDKYAVVKSGSGVYNNPYIIDPDI
ncbi:MAG: hypothetical protein IJB83_00065 [Bacilli bacterium]|nr:hypothetical protein [Bacilli bacterium]